MEKSEPSTQNTVEGQNERQKLSLQEATDLLPTGKEVHTFRNSSFMLIGADWPRAKVLKAIEKHGVELAGPSATAMKHGLVLFDDHGPLFIATREASSVPQA